MSENNNEATLTVPASVLQEVLNYLATRPFNEVSGLIDKVLKTAKANEVQESSEA